MDNPYSVFLDCGAPSLYNLLSRKVQTKGQMGSYMRDRRKDDFSYTEKEEYLKYRDDYIAYIKLNSDVIDVYSNLDVINNPEKTWENQLYMESKGLKPMPVFHFGTAVKWLQHYIRRGYEYVAIGGMTPNAPSVLIPGLDSLWKRYLVDDKGMPLIKVHGFAVTSFRLMKRYPWWSVDSTSWIKYGAYGSVWVPRFRNNSWDASELIRVICSEDNPKKFELGAIHIDLLPAKVKEIFIRFIEEQGFEIGTGNKEKDLRISDKARCELCGRAFLLFTAILPKWPWAFKTIKKGFSL